jgi:hypothetical protein
VAILVSSADALTGSDHRTAGAADGCDVARTDDEVGFAVGTVVIGVAATRGVLRNGAGVGLVSGVEVGRGDALVAIARLVGAVVLPQPATGTTDVIRTKSARQAAGRIGHPSGTPRAYLRK